MYPPDVTPPGCFPSGDELSVVTTESIIEWFMNFYEIENPLRRECVQCPGDLVFIPNGWWHCALNLEESIAVTQNFVNRYNLPNVISFLKKKPNSSLWNSFKNQMETQHPELWKQFTKPTLWETLTSSNTTFSFGT